MTWKHLFTQRPMALLACGAVVGILLQDRWTAALQHYVWIWALLGGVAVCLLLCRRFALTAGTLGTLGVFVLWHGHSLLHTRDHPIHQWLLQYPAGRLVTTTGEILTPFRDDLPADEVGRALFRIDQIEAPTQPPYAPKGALIRLYLPRLETLPPGRYRVLGHLRTAPPPDNPGEFDRRNYDLRRGIIGNLTASQYTVISQEENALRLRLLRAAESCRNWMLKVLALGLEQQEDAKAIIQAMTLGATETATRELQQPFRLSGTLHIFSVSGLHVGIVALIFWSLLLPLGLPRSLLSVLLILMLFGYAFLTGLRPSSVRAAIMGGVLLLGPLLNRRPDLLNSLGAAALLLLAIDTQQLFAPGFQLSFGVLAAIGGCTGFTERRLEPWVAPDPYLPHQLLTPWQRLTWKLRRNTAAAFSVSLAAFLGSTPLIAYYFHLVTPISVVANMVLVPVSFIILLLAILTMLATAMHLPWLPLGLTQINACFAKFALMAAQFFAAIPYGSQYLPPQGNRSPVEWTVLRQPAGGAANHLRLGREHWLLDTGHPNQYPYGLQPYLQYQGVNQIQGIILSHQDTEHTGAARLIVPEYQPSEILYTDGGPVRWQRSSEEKRAWETHPVGLRELHAGDVFHLGSGSDSAEVKVLYPPQGYLQRYADDRGLILLLKINGYRILWCQDAGFITEKYLLQHGSREELRCDVLIRNQHASDYSMLPEFLAAAQPRVIISSHQDFPPEEKISEGLRTACREHPIVLLDQAATGAVTMRFWPDRLALQAFRGSGDPLTLPRVSNSTTQE